MIAKLFRLILMMQLILPIASYAQSEAVSNGLNWLKANQAADGNWSSTQSSSTDYYTTVTALDSLAAFGETTSTAYTNGLSWVRNASVEGTTYLAPRVRAVAASGADATTDLNTLLSYYNAGYGWGGDAGHSTSTFHTAVGLQAVKAVSYSDPIVTYSSLAYLTQGQNSDGGWGFNRGDESSLYLTTVTSSVLQQFPQMTAIAMAINKGSSYIIAQQNADGGYGSSGSTIYETALAYITLVGDGQTQGLPIQNAVNYLISRQSANGSWNDDPYTTALAVKALYLSENRPSPPPPPPAGGRIAGTVIDAVSKAPVRGVAVVLASNSLINTTTDSSGNFTLADVPAGAQTVSFSLSGYASKTTSTNVALDSVASLGNVPLVSSYSTGTVAGTITDAAGKPLADVAITVIGSWSGSAVSGADGSYSFTYVTPGEVTIAAAKPGFQTVTGTGTVFARTTLSFSPRLSTTPSQVTTGTLVGRVVDDLWGVPIGHLPEEQGVTVRVGGTTVEPDERGYFDIQGLVPNTYQVTVGMNGFASQTFRVVITPGVTFDLGTIRLAVSFAMTLTGKVVDASTGGPIPGAEVAVTGTSLIGRTDYTGTYTITDIAHPADYTVKASATGYTGKSFFVRSSPWSQTLDIPLSPEVTTGVLTGMVVDAATDQPLAGVTLTTVSLPESSVTTDSAGTFTINAVPKGAQQINLALNGFTSRMLTTAISPGVVNDVGNVALSVSPVGASIQGIVWDAVANAPFAGVSIQAGTGSQQAVTTADGRYAIGNVEPGEVTVATGAVPKPGYHGARFTGRLEPGGLLVFNPSLSTTLPANLDVSVQSDKPVYKTGDAVAIAVNIRNREAVATVAALHVQVKDRFGVNAYETSVNVDLAADGAVDQSLSFVLPVSGEGGSYTILADVYAANGTMLQRASKTFGVAVSQITVTPNIPATFSTGANAVSFNLTNSGTLAVSAGTLAVTLKDPDGQMVATASLPFSLDPGQSTTLTQTVAIPALKFGSYTLSYLQGDETRSGTATDISLPNSIAISGHYDDSSHRIRGAANLTVAISNTGRFNLDTAGATGAAMTVTASVPDAAYSETKVSPAPAAGASGTVLVYSFAIPETMTAGQHGTKITVTLSSGSNIAQTTQLAIMESYLSLSPIQAGYAAGNNIRPAFTNSGGVDTQVQYRLSLYDAKSALIAEQSGIETVAATATLPLSIAIPTGAVDGSYNLVVGYKDLKTGKEGTAPNAITISGVRGSLQVKTDKQNYLLSESIAGIGTINVGGAAVQEGKLHLQVVTGAGVHKTKTWTTQADFQTGVRNGVDTYGVNDWIIPDDDFDGVSLDANKWNTYGVVRVESGKVITDSTNVASGVVARYLLNGDFDIQVDFSMNNSASLEGAGFAVRGSDGAFSIGVTNSRSGYYSSQTAIQDGWGSEKFYVGTYAGAGRVRLTRTGTTLVSYYWTGTSWAEVLRATSDRFVGPCYPFMNVYRGLGLAASAAYDNFKVNSGRIQTVNQTVDSVRLLPLNDNFDDGVLNEDRWGFVSDPKPVENSGVVRLISTTASPYQPLVLRTMLAGDFSAVSAYKNYNATLLQSLQGRYIMGAGVSNSNFYINRCYDLTRAGGNFIVSLSSIDKYYQMTSDVPYTSDSGQFRLRREGSTGFTDYWDGTQWINQHSRSMFPSGAASMKLYTLSDNGVTINADVDRFYTNKGTYANDGTLTLKYDSGTISNQWETLLFAADVTTGTSLRFRTRTAETQAGLDTALWSSYVTSSGSEIGSLPGRWIEVEASLSTTNSNVTPLLNYISVTYTGQPNEILWQTDLPSNLAPDSISEVNSVIGSLGLTGKFYFEGTLTSSTGQTVAVSQYPFYVEQGNVQLLLTADKTIYRPGETVTVAGEVKNLSSVGAAGLMVRVQGAGLYTEAIDVAANSAHPFNFTTIAGSAGVYQFKGVITQNSTTLAEIADQFEVATPELTAALTAPETVGTAPFTLSLSLSNTGKVSASTNVRVLDDGGDVIGEQSVTVAAGESRVLQYIRQISGVTTYTAAVSGDLNQTLTKKVAYVVVATDSTVTGKIATDKVSYNPNEQVALATTVSASSMRENLSTLVTVVNSQGQSVYSVTAAIPVLIQGQVVTNKHYWNSGSYAPGTYLATLQVLDAGGAGISKATCNLVINSTTQPAALLKGKVSLDRQSILTGEPITASYSVTNAGNVDLANVSLSVRTVTIDGQAAGDTLTDQTTLAIGASQNNNGRIDTRNYSAKDYFVVLLASIDGVEETLAGTFFRVEGAPSIPALSGPGNGTDLETFTPTLSVSNAADPNDDRLSYQFEIYADSGLTTLIDSGMVSETDGSTSWTVPALLAENETYYWRVRAYDGLLYGPWMAPVSFRVNSVDDPPSAPTISGPADGTDVALLTPILSVGNAADPDSASLTYNFEIALDPAFTEMVASAKGISSGEATSSWSVPEYLQENGLYYWRAQADDWLIEGPWSATARFFVNTANDAPSVPVVLAPADGSTIAALATDAVVTNSTDPDSPMLSYYFEADTVPTFDSTGIIRSGGVPAGEDTTLWRLSGLLDNTRYHLRVKASDGTVDSPWSAVPGFFVNTANDPPTTPILANPSSGAGVNVFSPTLSVHNAADLDHDALTYEFEVYEDAAMTKLVARSSGIAETAGVTQWQIPVPLAENQNCYWRVRAFDGALYGGWTAAASFMVNTANDAPNAPKLSSPAEGNSVVTPLPMLAVVNAVDPDSDNLTYEFEVYSGGSLVSAVAGVTAEGSGITTWTTGTPLADNTIYQWRARAYDGDSYGPWMAMANFTVHIPKTSINATVDFDPDTLNRSSKGTWVVVYIELPAGFKPADVDIPSIRLEATIPAEARPYDIGDRDKDGIADLMVKFRRSDLINLLSEGERVPVQVTGKVGSMLFEGVDVIRVIK